MNTLQIEEPLKLSSIGRRLVYGEDIVELQEYFDLTLLEITYLMGNYGGRFHNIVDPDSLGSPLKSVPRSLFVRTLIDWHLEGRTFPVRTEMYPWPMLIPKTPDHRELFTIYDRFKDQIEANWPQLTQANITIILGLSGKHVTDRWEGSSEPGEKASSPHPIVQRMMTYLIADVRNRGFSAIEDHMHRVEDEAIARKHLGLDDVLKKSRWNTNKDVGKIEEEILKRERRREKRAEAREKKAAEESPKGEASAD